MKTRRRSNAMPEVNLVPMMDVVMTILTFFIIVSMTLTNGKTVKDVSLPSAQQGASQDVPDSMVVGLNRQGQTIIDDQPVGEAQMAEKVVDYLKKNPKGSVVIKADKSLTYEKVIKAIGVLRDIGGDRVSLAVE
ncbi:MAG: biopolymer transporter ExbD [Alkalinema sp. RU_4_3]|nr:biopolymer transporter ExbD [Alkalinema sp. RU_4_3]